MSELAKTIERLQLWIKHWQPHYPVEFIADLWRVLGTASAAQEAVEVLQSAQRHHPENAGEMEACTQGEWIAISDVRAAIDILQEGQQ